ncbi:Conserved hypothetical protein CHP02466 [uncultured Caudovirales phage]|uniref:Uncharacterized protein n=1 Tax=uncultured Caudovirales phage TaxID=2100421 RepID=A0A6J7WVF7_9CAUD|nr:Conserved hypothetical protein CHP02466 [uncultured Caudovirales phage]
MSFGIENFDIDLHFSTSVYRINRADLLPAVKPVFDEYVGQAIANGVDDTYPGVMTTVMHEDSRMSSLVNYISEIAWDVLDNQGYDMSLFYTSMHAMWGQNHPKMSSMDYHNHPNTVLTCFYFIDTPSDSSMLSLYDPRQSKVFSNLPVKQDGKPSLAIDSINYTPNPGDIIFTNGWLPHSFSRNRSNIPYNFLHINIGVIPKQSFDNINSEPVVV